MDPVLTHIPLLLHIAGFVFLFMSGIFRRPNMMQGVPTREEMIHKLSTFRDGLILFLAGSTVALYLAFMANSTGKMMLHAVILLIVTKLIMIWNNQIAKASRNPFQ